MTVPLAKNGGVTHWILTDKNLPPDSRPIYASCESLRKRAVSARPGADGQVVLQDGIAHGIASVFTDPRYRGKGYASAMMNKLGPTLAKWTDGRQGNVVGAETTAPGSLFSVLYSDIGKTFYAKTGWAAFESAHFSFPPVAASSGSQSTARPLGFHDLAMLCNLDEQLMKTSLQQRARNLEGGKKACGALVPELDQFLWHLFREDFMTKHIFGKTPSIRGAIYGEPGKRLWAVWTRGYYGGLDKIEGNTFHILRFVVEDENMPEERVVEGFRSIIQVAQAEAAEWRSQDVQMWNPSAVLKNAAAKSGLSYEFIDRDKESIASLMWYGDEPTAAIDWVANEKYSWC